jgi:hypothetical protein
VNGDGVPDECLPPGEWGVVALMQDRTLYVRADDAYEGCDEEDFDEALDFSPYQNALSVVCGCGEGEASQDSYIERMNVRAGGAASGHGAGGGGHDCRGWGESIYRVVFGAPYAESALLSGRISVEMSAYPYPIPLESRVELFDADEHLLYQIELVSEDEATIEFHEIVDLDRAAAYLLRAEANVTAIGESAYGMAEFDLELSALGDVDGDWDVDSADLLALLGAWGPNEDHPADFDGDGLVNTADLLALLGNWGP